MDEHFNANEVHYDACEYVFVINKYDNSYACKYVYDNEYKKYVSSI